MLDDTARLTAWQIAVVLLTLAGFGFVVARGLIRLAVKGGW